MAGVQEVLAERYELLEVLGRGGMGVVYRARDRVLDRIVAVKVLPFDRAQDPTSVARFEREALAVAALSHRNIVAVFDAGSDGETHFIVMEYLRGQSLAELLRERGAFDGAQAVDVTAQVASALAAAHAAGIVHRDIKPANVMLDEHGHVKVLDFGIARLASGISLTQTAMVVGSAPYLAPELCRGAAADARSDIYALGCVLYALLTGQPPFSGEVPAAVIHQQLSAAPRAPSVLDPTIPAALSALSLAMLAKEPDARPQHAQDLVTALPAALAGVALGAEAEAGAARVAVRAGDETTRAMASSAAFDPDATRAMTEPTRLMPEPTRVMPRAAPGTASQSPPRGRRALALIAVATVAVVVAALLAFTGGSGPGRARAAKHSSVSKKAAAKRPATSTATTPTTVTTATTTDTTTTTTTTTTTAAGDSSTLQTVTSAATSLESLVEKDAQAGTVATPAANAIMADVQQLAAADTSGQNGPVYAGFMKLGSDLGSFAQHGQINASAIPGLNAAVASLGTALEQSAAATATTQATPGAGQTTPGTGQTAPGAGQTTPGTGQTTPGVGQQPGPGPHHGRSGGGLPPGQAKKLGDD